MKRKLNKILEELYEIDSSLKENNGLWKIVENMIFMKPDIKINEHFKNDLKIRLNKEIVKTVNQKNEKVSFFQIFKYAFSGIVVTSFGIFSLLNLWFFDNVINNWNKEIIQVPKKSVKTEEIEKKHNIENIQEKPDDIYLDKGNISEKTKDSKLRNFDNKDTKIETEEKVISSENIVNDEIKSDLQNQDSEDKSEFVFPKEAYDILFDSSSSTMQINSTDSVWEMWAFSDMWQSYKMSPSLMMSDIDSEKQLFINKIKNLKIYWSDLWSINESSTWILVISENKDFWMTFSINFDSMFVDIEMNQANFIKNDSQIVFLEKDEVIDILKTFISNYNLELSIKDWKITENNWKNVVLFVWQVKIIIDPQMKKIIWVYNY